MMVSSRIASVEHLIRPLRRFYREDARRARSREIDVGLRWRDRDGSTYRAAWVEETGELYAVRHGDPDSAGRATVLAEVSAETLEREVGGWRELCESDEPGTYEELRERVAAFSSRR
jgi:hypothetical protein